MDPFSLRRLLKFLESFRTQTGQLPMLSDFATAGFDKDTVNWAVRKEHIEEFYVTLSDGSVRKGYKVKIPNKV